MIVVDDVGIVELPEVVEGLEGEVMAIEVVGVGLLDDIYCRNARGAVGGTPVLRARGGGVEAEGACWR